MSPSSRDTAIIRHADYFKQLATSHILALAFHGAQSRTSADRVLKRLVDDKYLAKVERRRSIGGARGGSGEYVYMLGPQGWALCKREGRWHRLAIDYHALAIADVYVKLTQAHRAGVVELAGFTPEPECHVSVQGVELKPDIYVELARPGTGRTLRAWLEIDLGTERQARIAEKLDRYVRAFESGQVDPFPRVVFLGHDAERAQELAWMIGRRPSDEPRLFQALSFDDFPVKL